MPHITVINVISHVKLFALIMLMFTFISLFPVSACTIFTVSQDDNVYFGNNEDYINPNTYMMIRPSERGKFGAIYFGFDNFFYQGGINSRGLCFDGNSISGQQLENHPERLKPSKWIVTTIMETCTNISEVIATAQQYNWYSQHSVLKYQLHFADRFGDAVILSPGFDGEINFTRKSLGDGYLVSTNYNLSYGNQSDWCWRYDTAVVMLNTITDNEGLSIEFCRDILDSVHQEGDYVNTLYSNIFDLKKKMIYLYYHSQFKEEVAEVNVTEKLSSGVYQNIPLIDLFSPKVIDRASSINTLFKTQRNIQTLIGNLVVILNLLGILIIIYVIIRRVRN